MSLYLSAGIYIKESDFSQYVRVISTTVSGMIGIAEKGVLNKPGLVTNLDQYFRKYGSYNIASNFPLYVKQYFENGGSVLYVNPVAHYTDITDLTTLTAVKASYTLKDRKIGNNQAQQNIGLIEANSHKSWGNNLNVTVSKVENIVTAANLTNGALSVVLNTVNGLSIGDKVYIADSTQNVAVVVTWIDSTTKTIYFPAVTLAATISSGATVKTSSSHILMTQLASGETLETNDTQINLNSTDGVEIGSIVSIMDRRTTNPYVVNVVVTSVSGKTIYFDSVGTITSILAANSKVVTQEFDFYVSEQSVLVEKFEFVSPEASNVTNNCETRINNISDYVTFEIQTNTNDPIDQIPEPVYAAKLTGGLDGSTVQDTDYIGSSNTKTGLYAFDAIEDLNTLAIPGISSTTVIHAAITYTENRQEDGLPIMYVIDTPNNLEPQEVVDFRYGQGNYTHASLVSNKCAMYYPWFKVSHPVTNTKTSIAPSATMLGVYARNDQLENVWYAPAGIQRAVLRNVVELEYYISSGENRVLYKNNINPIRDFDEGFTVWGQKTLANQTSALDRINVRRLLHYLEKSVRQSTKFLVFEPNDPITWRRLVRLLDPFLNNIVKERGLYSYYVQCDSVINTPDVIDRNEMKCRVFVKPVKAAEFIEINFVITNTGATFSEIFNNQIPAAA